MAIEFEKTYSQEEFRNLLTTFQNDIQQNKYNERIPYNFNKANKIHVMTHNLFVEVSAFLSEQNVRNIKSMILALVVFSTIMF